MAVKVEGKVTVRRAAAPLPAPLLFLECVFYPGFCLPFFFTQTVLASMAAMQRFTVDQVNVQANINVNSFTKYGP